MPSFIDRLQKAWADLNPFLKFFVVVAFLAAAVFLGWKPGSRAIRGWQTNRDLKAAGEALSRNQFAEARGLAFQAIRRDSTATAAIPILLRAEDAMGDPQRVQMAIATLSNRRNSADDRLFAWRVICLNASTWFAAAGWNGLQEHESADPLFLEPWAARLLREAAPEQAEKLLLKHPEPRPVALERLYLDTLAAKGDDEATRQLQERLLQRIEASPGDAPLLWAVTDAVPTESLLWELSSAGEKWRAGAAQLEPADELRLARFKIVATPSRADEIFADTLTRFSLAEPLATARWCLLLDRETEAAKLLEPLALAGNEEAYSLLSGIHRRTGSHEEWAVLLSALPADLSPALLDCDRAFIAWKNGDIRAQNFAEKRSIEAAANVRVTDDSLIRLARHAGELGLTDLSRQLWVEAIRKASGPLPLSSRVGTVFRELAEKKDEDSLLAVLSVYRFLEPTNPNILCKQLYLACLMGRATPENVIAQLDSQPQSANDPQAMVVLALAHLLLGDASKAKAVTDGEKIDWFAMSPAQRAIRAIVLNRSGNPELARLYLEDLPWDSLLPSEQRILGEMAK